MKSETIDDFLDMAIEQASEKSKKCKECFCNDLCLFVLMRKGQVTSCEDWQNRVRRVVDRELEKIK